MTDTPETNGTPRDTSDETETKRQPHPGTGRPHGRSDKLSTAQLSVLESMLSGLTQSEAARRAGSHPSAVARWVNKDGLFRRTLLERREARAKAAQKALEDVAREEVTLQARARRLAWGEAVAQLEGLAQQRQHGKWKPSAFAALKLGELAIKLTEMGNPTEETERQRLEAMSPEDRAREFQASLRAAFGVTDKPPPTITKTG